MRLKETLAKLQGNNYTTENIDLNDLIDSMLANIGAADPVLRDELIYSRFCGLVMEDYLSEEQLQYILNITLDDEHLFYRIGEKASDSVFTRSFSALVVALIMEKEKQKPFLESETIHTAGAASLEYLRREQDIRGYVKEKGWAHSIAHGADMLAAVIHVRGFETDFMNNCLEVIGMCLFKGVAEDGPYIDEEEERLIFAVEALMDKGLEDGVLERWLLSLSDKLEEVLKEEGYSLLFFRKKTNVLNFLKALYFRLALRGGPAYLLEVLLSMINKWHNKFYSDEN